jgi:hypothetical protein
MHVSLPQMAERMADEVNSGAIEWGDILLGPRFAKGELTVQFYERLATEGADFLEGLANTKGWTKDRLRLIVDGEDTPTPFELEAWAEAFEIEPDWLLSAPLIDASGTRGWALLIQNIPYCDGGPLFEVLETFADERAAGQYLNENWPELRA